MRRRGFGPVGGGRHHGCMIMQPPDVSWLHGEYSEECYSFVCVRATPERVVTRLGGRWENCMPGPFPDDPDHYPGPGRPARRAPDRDQGDGAAAEGLRVRVGC